jgi:hypothetical protein
MTPKQYAEHQKGRTQMATKRVSDWQEKSASQLVSELPPEDLSYYNNPLPKPAPATEAQVRESYKSLGYEVRITRDGHVTYRARGTAWLEGRWVSEYVVIDDGSVILR